MTCTPVVTCPELKPVSIICSFADAETVLVVTNGRQKIERWHCEFSRTLGPNFTNLMNGRYFSNPPPRVWRAFERWCGTLPKHRTELKEAGPF